MENLPLELFGALSEFLFANEVCWLWLSGSKRLHYLLENGITCFHHLPAQRRAYHWPSFISRFKRLQTAYFGSIIPYNMDQLYHNVVLSDIPTSVTSLKLDFPNGFLSLLQPPSTNMISSDISLPAMPLSTMFPNLTHLEVYNVIEMAERGKNVISSWDPILALPLSTLHLSLFRTCQMELLKALSPTITSLKLPAMPEYAFSFPPHLVALSLQDFCGSIDTSVLPMTLHRLSLHCTPTASIQCRNWPFELEKLSITHPGLRLCHTDIKALPNTLTSLRLVILSLEFACLHDLPQKLRFFFLNAMQALSAISIQEWSLFEPKRLPPGLTDGSIGQFFEHTPHERLNTFPIGIRTTSTAIINSPGDFVPPMSLISDRMDKLIWGCPKPEINWSFKNLKTLIFGVNVHPGQAYLTLPLLPLLAQLTLGRYIEDPSLALNRITSPFISTVAVNCHPISLCKWNSRWLQCIHSLSVNFDPSAAPESDWFGLLDSSGYHLDESSRNDILAMDNADWQDWEHFGSVRTIEDGEKVPFINWSLYASVLPRSLIGFDLPYCKPMENPSRLHSHSDCDWPPRLERLYACVFPRDWSSLPWCLTTFGTWEESTDLVELAENLDTLPKMVNYIHVKFIHSTAVSSTLHLPIVTKLLQNRPQIISLQLGFGSEMKLTPPYNNSLTGAIAATFGLPPLN